MRGTASFASLSVVGVCVSLRFVVFQVEARGEPAYPAPPSHH